VKQTTPASNKGKEMNNSQAKKAIEKLTGTEILFTSWKCDGVYEGTAEAFINPEKKKVGRKTFWSGDVKEKGESWDAKTRCSCTRYCLLSLAHKLGLEVIAAEIQNTIDKARQAELNAYCGVTDLN
jgi:hypothetical protein